MRTQWMVSSGAIALASFLLGCGSGVTIQSGGFTVNKEFAEDAFEKVKSRASFEFECPKEKLNATVVAVDVGPLGFTSPKQVGVAGCGHKAVYLQLPDGTWARNSAGKEVQKPATP